MTTILNSLFTTDDRGTFTDLILDTIAEAYGVTIDEADAFVGSLVAARMVAEDENGDLYDIDEREAYEAEEAEEIEDWNQYLVDRADGYAIACC